MKKNKIPSWFKPVFWLAIIFLALWIIISYSLKVIGGSGYFVVKEIVSNNSTWIDLSYLKEKDILNLDLNQEARRILSFCPECSAVKVVRVLPNRIFVDFLRRKPIAIVKLYKYFAIDERGIFFNLSDDWPKDSLPLILGLESKVFGPKQGKKYNSKELSCCLGIIKEVGFNKAFKDYRVTKIDVTTPGTITFFLLSAVNLASQDILSGQVSPGVIEIKLSLDNIKPKLAILSGVFISSKNDLGAIKYVDLRFNEPVIKFNEIKLKRQ